MKGIFYRFLVILTKLLGPWAFGLIARGIALFYFIFSPVRVSASISFYKALYPDRSVFYHLWCTLLQYQNFTSIYLDRILLQDSSKLTHVSDGWENIETVLKNGRGGIMLMSHLGNWEVAALLLKQKKMDLRLLLYMGVRYKEDIERIQKEDLTQSGIRIIAVEENGGSPFDLIEGVRFLNSGGLVSMTGDLIWKAGQDAVEVDFLGHKASLPKAPYILAMLSGAPLLIFFSFRTGKNKYCFSISEPIHIEKKSRAERQKHISQAAQTYAGLLEQAVREHPFEWYHFEPFITSYEK